MAADLATQNERLNMNIPSHMRYCRSKTLTLTPWRYANGALAIRAVDADTGEPIAVLTVNLPDIKLAPGDVLIKDYAENEGALETLLQAGVVEALEVIPCGYAEVIRCRLLKEIS